MNLLLMFVGLLHGLGVGSLNSLLDLSVEILNLFGSLLHVPTKFGGSREGSKVQRIPRIETIDHLKWRKSSGLTLCFIKGKLRMGKEFIPPLHILLYKHPK